MRGALLVWSLIVVGEAAAAPVPVAPAKPDRAGRDAARHFAIGVHSVVDQVVENYFRPQAPEPLLEAALVGLYRAARRPVPRDLRARVRDAVAEAHLLRVGGERPTATGLDPRVRLLAQAHQQLAGAEALLGQNAVLVCCQALARVLDPHSGLVHSDEQRRAVGLDHESVGVGLEFKDGMVGPLVVEQVHLGGPAQRAGLRPGDVITHVDGIAASKAPPEKLKLLQTGRVVFVPPSVTPEQGAPPAPPPGLVRVRYRRGNEKSEASLPRERFRAEMVLGVRRREDNAWDYFADERQGLAHVRLSTLGRGAAEELRGVLAYLSARKVRGVLLDLRWCPGGYLNEAVEAADLFLGEGVVATVKTRQRDDTVYRSTEADQFNGFAVVILVNGATSGGAELIAAALQDHGRAVVVGQRTLGKASVQTPIAVGVEGVGFKLTSGTFIRPSGRNLHRLPDSKPDDDWGVVPEHDCRVSRELGQRLKGWWQLYSLRPGRSSARLALDDPSADPQQQAALAVLRRLLDRKVRAKGG